MKERKVTIEGTTYEFVKAPHKCCDDCDILKDSMPVRMFDGPLCYKYTTRGNRATSDRGLIVNLCARNLSRIWKKI